MNKLVTSDLGYMIMWHLCPACFIRTIRLASIGISLIQTEILTSWLTSMLAHLILISISFKHWSNIVSSLGQANIAMSQPAIPTIMQGWSTPSYTSLSYNNSPLRARKALPVHLKLQLPKPSLTIFSYPSQAYLPRVDVFHTTQHSLQMYYMVYLPHRVERILPICIFQQCNTVKVC